MVREAPISSVQGFGTAESMAKLYGMVSNGGRYKVNYYIH